MPQPRARRPWRPKPTWAELGQLCRLAAAEWRHRRIEAWTQLVVRESWRLVRADGLRACGAAEFARGEQSLIDQGLTPPPGAERRT
jgi:hypothetical protein